jgi:hypothetical protein
MRRSLSLSVLGIGALVLVATAWASGSSAPPPECSAADTLKRVTLFAPPYARACGPARAVVRVGATTYVMRGGYCRRLDTQPTDALARYGVTVGLFTNRPTGAPGYWRRRAVGRSIAFWWVQPKPARAGRFEIAETSVEVPGSPALAAGGFVTVPRGLNSGTFSFVDSGSATRITGSFRCR